MRLSRFPSTLVWLVTVVPLLISVAVGLTPSRMGLGANSSYPNDAYFPRQWNLHNTGQDGGRRGADIRALKAWRVTDCSPSVPIAVLDTAVDGANRDLEGKVIASTSVVPRRDGRSTFPHGTAVGGVIAADTDNRLGVAGVCPEGRLMSVAVADWHGVMYEAWLASGIRWAVGHGARVINMSLSSYGDYYVLDSAVYYAHEHGVVLVASVPNRNYAPAAYPAADPYVTAVDVTNNRDKPWRKTHGNLYGDLVLAPAINIPVIWGEGVRRESGNSFAAAQVSGLAALILSIRPDLNPDQVTYAIERGADPVEGEHGANDDYGWGRINCYKSLKIAMALPRRHG